jgi:hypothetical protein
MEAGPIVVDSFPSAQPPTWVVFNTKAAVVLLP